MLSLSPALATDADSIASIHMTAFGQNAMLFAQLPITAIRDDVKIMHRGESFSRHTRPNDDGTRSARTGRHCQLCEMAPA